MPVSLYLGAQGSAFKVLKVLGQDYLPDQVQQH